MWKITTTSVWIVCSNTTQLKLQNVLFLFFPSSAPSNRGWGLSTDAAYTRTFTVTLLPGHLIFDMVKSTTNLFCIYFMHIQTYVVKNEYFHWLSSKRCRLEIEKWYLLKPGMNLTEAQIWMILFQDWRKEPCTWLILKLELWILVLGIQCLLDNVIQYYFDEVTGML